MADQVFTFDVPTEIDKTVLGGKGCSLMQMSNIGLDVPPFFVIPCQTCVHYMENQSWPVDYEAKIWAALKKIEDATGRKFGDSAKPLLLSVRSGARVSMPGMMDTVLNLGLNDESVEGLAKDSGNERFAWDAYRRFIQMYGDVVLGVPHKNFEHILEGLKKKYSAAQDTDLSAEHLKECVAEYRAMVKKTINEEFPKDPKDQLIRAINAVFDSWTNERAVYYRNMHSIDHRWGTAVNVQSMVFGNLGQTSGTGVGFTRDPATGEKMIYGEFLPNAQGEDVVAGIRTPIKISDMESVGGVWPGVYKQLCDNYDKLEAFYKDMVDLEFTVQDGKLYMLQARVGKRTAAAMVRIAAEMVKEGMITEKEALLRQEPNKIGELLHKTFDPKAVRNVVATGLPASPGAGVGRVEFTAADAEARFNAGEPAILVRAETSPRISSVTMSQGILTARGGCSSHAAVVARGMGKCCVAGCSAVEVDEEAEQMKINGKVFKRGDWLSLDGSTGEVIEGQLATIAPVFSENFNLILQWADKYRQLDIRTNADTPADAKQAVAFGAQGIGLTRTEHMFFEHDRIYSMREMIVSETAEQRKAALAKLLPFQRDDFIGMFKALEGRPANIRLLDPPLHEFVSQEMDFAPLIKATGKSEEELRAFVDSLAEANPMLGFRGCRLGMVYPEISRMQARAIMEAAAEVQATGLEVHPEIMIPVLNHVNEMEAMRKLVADECEKVLAEKNIKVDYHIGTMIELPRACITADKIAEHAEYFSFGTNDLTQTTTGISRDDYNKFMPVYLDKSVYPFDFFQRIDTEGVGELMKMAVQKGRTTRPGMKIGICGEQTGQESVFFCQQIGLTYISCSPFRVPGARVSAAQAALLYPREQ
ncbi:pyruvate phosphate dikinase [Carpediemonas membranifera]|uniref:pyruvate, phosphate dikinase n=1 Tax=Carpediemonas membranifera TaxID=201153 RepID=A0A8J6B534_9EUKA|nr:pyruvate phosphate dikinase [Carpediemonas membranifera]|eukprot:KAG9395838.1 pyruvate phosphate dikinase [Carpediemonas membranifera]